MPLLHEVVSKKRQKQLKEFLGSPLSAGEIVSLKDEYHKVQTYRIKAIVGDGMVVCNVETPKKEEVRRVSDVVRRYDRHIGTDPFDPDRNRARMVQFNLDSIIHTLDLLGERQQQYHIGDVSPLECNWDPFVYDKDGNKQRYQRPLVWKLAQKQALLLSIYNGVDCGKVLIRERNYTRLEEMYANGERELAYHDIVDGKQRLYTIREFILGEFKDSHGNKYGDLSDEAQSNFLSHQLFSYCALPDKTTDDEVLRQFLKLNFTGVPQSKTHMKYVESLRNKMQ